MNNPQLVFSQGVEGLLIGINDDLTPRLRGRLKEAGLDADSRLEPAYPAERWASWLRLLAHDLYPGLPEPMGLREIGARVARGYGQTAIGRAVMALLRVMGPMRALARIERNFRGATNFMTVTFTQMGPRDAELFFNESNGVPDYLAGIILGTGPMIGAADTRVEIVETDGHRCRFRVKLPAP